MPRGLALEDSTLAPVKRLACVSVPLQLGLDQSGMAVVGMLFRRTIANCQALLERRSF